MPLESLTDLTLPLTVVVVGLLIVLGMAARRLRRLPELERRLEQSRRELARRDRDQQSLVAFIREFPELSRQLHTRLSTRQLGDILIAVIEKVFEPEQAVIVLGKPGPSVGGEVTQVLRVVASTGIHGREHLGKVIEPGHGEIGLVAEVRRQMTRQDFDAQPRATAHQLRTEGIDGFQLDVAAAMVVGETTYGVLALSRPGRRMGAQIELINAIAQLGGLSSYNAQVYDQFRHQAQVDKLTGAFNKGSILDSLSREMIELQQTESTLSVFLFDIDNFKNYNDQNGHLAGDKLLAELSRLVVGVVRSEDLFGRFGGEEFLLVLPDTDLASAMVVAEKVRNLIAGHPFAFAERQPLGCLSVSGGVASYPVQAQSSVNLLRLADEALYRAKEQGRNRVLAARRTTIGGA